MRTNWRDGGGCYPPGSDTPDAPWNQHDVEPSQEHIDEATKDVWVLVEWEYGTLAPDDTTFNAVNEMIQIVVPYSYFDDEFGQIMDAMEIVAKDRGIGAALDIMPENRKAEIKRFAEKWIDERAADLAREGF